ncbi:MAG: ribosome biogenesis GTPase Der [Coriobacteriales bacterium]|nr:ribosome biogenesis GTPase Der [Coriobacteriales bacterium]
MALPIVAVVGRPNVGKSTFVNRIALTKDAIVHEQRGVTRDRSYHQADWNGRDFVLIDTGGIEMGAEDAFQNSIRNQALLATEEADVILFMTDARSGLTADDIEVTRLLKRSGHPVMLLVNKMDNPAEESALWEFHNLGLGSPWPVSSTHGHGTGDLLDELVALLPAVDTMDEGRSAGAAAAADVPDAAAGHGGGHRGTVLLCNQNGHEADTAAQKNRPSVSSSVPSVSEAALSADAPAIPVAIIGRPNVGKSSLTNRLVGRERSIVSDVAGTTRDAIDTLVEHEGTRYRIIDTAGIRRKSKIDESVEYYGFVRALRAIDRADVALLMIDSVLGLTDNDQRVANLADERGCALIVLLNKWDLLETPEEREALRTQIADRLPFVSYAPALAISALTGRSVHRIWGAIDSVYANFSAHIPTPKLNALLTELRDFGHTVSRGKLRLRIHYVTQTGVCPPQFTFFANHPHIIDSSFRRYLEGRLREAFALEGTPVRLRFKKKD